MPNFGIWLPSTTYGVWRRFRMYETLILVFPEFTPKFGIWSPSTWYDVWRCFRMYETPKLVFPEFMPKFGIWSPPSKLMSGACSVPFIQVFGLLEVASSSPPYGCLHTNQKARSISRCIYNSGHLLHSTLFFLQRNLLNYQVKAV